LVNGLELINKLPSGVLDRLIIKNSLRQDLLAGWRRRRTNNKDLAKISASYHKQKQTLNKWNKNTGKNSGAWWSSL
jgi:hypothetical protein